MDVIGRLRETTVFPKENLLEASTAGFFFAMPQLWVEDIYKAIHDNRKDNGTDSINNRVLFQKNSRCTNQKCQN